MPELSPEDCPGLEEGLRHCNPSSLPLIEKGKISILLEKHVWSSQPRAQPLKERFHHMIVDHFPPPDLSLLGGGVITMITEDRAARSSGSAEKRTVMLRSRRHQTKARGEPGVSDTQGNSKPHPESILPRWTWSLPLMACSSQFLSPSATCPASNKDARQ